MQTVSFELDDCVQKVSVVTWVCAFIVLVLKSWNELFFLKKSLAVVTRQVCLALRMGFHQFLFYATKESVTACTVQLMKLQVLTDIF